MRSWAALACWTAGGLLAVLWLAVAGFSAFAQSRLGAQLDAMARPSRARSPVVIARFTRTAALVDGLVGRLEIPSAGIRTMVIEGDDAATLARGVGHVPHTAFPGERGNAVLAGHRDSFFRGLGRVAVGDPIAVVTPDGRFDYTIHRIQVVPPERTSVLAPSPRAQLTLVTCYPLHWIGPAPKRLIVTARWADRAQAWK